MSSFNKGVKHGIEFQDAILKCVVKGFLKSKGIQFSKHLQPSVTNGMELNSKSTEIHGIRDDDLFELIILALTMNEPKFGRWNYWILLY